MDFKIIFKVLIDSLKIDSVKLPTCDVLTFACDNDRYIKYDGKIYSPLINTVEDRLNQQGLSCVSISRIASTIKGKLSHGRVYSPEGRFSRAMLSKRIKNLFISNKKYPFSWLEVKIWEDILSQTGAKSVVAILPSRELCYVCRQRDIWVCDLQHGVIADEHYWYGESFRKNDPTKWLPNAFLVWDQGSYEVINKWASHKKIDVNIVGNPWIERFRNKSKDDSLINNLKIKYKITKKEKKNILVSLSWGVHGLENKFFHPSLEQLIKDTANTYNWKLRLHPNQIRGFASDEGREFISYYEKHFKNLDVEWENSTEMPLPLLLSNIDCHITWLSSVCMEAAYFGIPSLVLCPKLQRGGEFESYYNYLVDLGYVDKLIPDYNAIKEWIERKSLSKMPYYCDHAVNFDKIIQSIVNRANNTSSLWP